jgi:hypothetical protein
LRSLFAVASILFAGSTPALASNPLPEQTTNPQKIALAVAVVEQLDLARIGPMVFFNKRSSITLPDDSIDELVASTVEAELAKEGSVAVKRLPIPSADRRITRRAIFESVGGTFSRSFSSIPDQLRHLISSCECERLLLVIGTPSNDGTGSSQRFGPLSWIGLTGFDEVPTYSSIRLSMAFLLVDPTSTKLLAYATSTNEQRDGSPFEAVNAKLWPKSMSEIEPATWDLVIETTRKLLTRKTRFPLYQLGLRPSCTSRYGQRSGRPDRQDVAATDLQIEPGSTAAKCD